MCVFQSRFYNGLHKSLSNFAKQNGQKYQDADVQSRQKHIPDLLLLLQPKVFLSSIDQGSECVQPTKHFCVFEKYTYILHLQMTVIFKLNGENPNYIHFNSKLQDYNVETACNYEMHCTVYFSTSIYSSKQLQMIFKT